MESSKGEAYSQEVEDKENPVMDEKKLGRENTHFEEGANRGVNGWRIIQQGRRG